MTAYEVGAVFRPLWVLVCVFVLASGFSKDASGYVVPPEQLLKFMAENVTGFETLGVTWQYGAGGGEAGQEPVTQDIWFRSNEDYSVHDREGPDRAGSAVPDARFIELFCGKRHRSERFLMRQGVDLDVSVYTRLDGTVAYRIGGEMSGAPLLVLEKSRFIPLLLRCDPDHEAGGIMEVRFKDYRRVGEGWFPHEIFYRGASGVTGSYTVLDVRPNEPAPRGFSPVDESKAGKTVPGGEKGRLERVIKAFEEKYGNQ